MLWYCWNRDHLHSTEIEAQWCMELYELWELATVQLMAYVREDEVELQVNLTLADLEES